MDAQKISEAASLIKKAALADSWLQNLDLSSAIGRTLQIDTVGDYTMLSGHGEACAYLRRAFELFKQQILDTAIEFAASDALEAKKVIRAEAEYN